MWKGKGESEKFARSYGALTDIDMWKRRCGGKVASVMWSLKRSKWAMHFSPTWRNGRRKCDQNLSSVVIFSHITHHVLFFFIFILVFDIQSVYVVLCFFFLLDVVVVNDDCTFVVSDFLNGIQLLFWSFRYLPVFVTWRMGNILKIKHVFVSCFYEDVGNLASQRIPSQKLSSHFFLCSELLYPLLFHFIFFHRPHENT